jgi:DNA repair protein RadA/Sms
MECSLCGCPIRMGYFRCPSCKHWNVSEFDDADVVTLSDESEKEIPRLVTGLCDECLGGGLVPSTVTLLGGSPGGGKTTLCLQLSDIVSELTGKPTAYIGYEQPASELRGTANRLRLKHQDKIKVLKTFGNPTRSVGDTLRGIKPGLIILDSVTAAVGDDHNAAIAMCKQFKALSVELNAPSIIIAHVTKEHDFAGPMSMQHWVDCLVSMYPDGPTQVRMLTWKNRFGPKTEQLFNMTATGLTLALDEDEECEESGDEEDEYANIEKVIAEGE